MEQDNQYTTPQSATPPIPPPNTSLTPPPSSALPTTLSEPTPTPPWQTFMPLILFIVTIASVIAWLLSQTPQTHEAIKHFTNVYSFVPEKLSKSAPIPISLPDNITEEVAKQSISFSPDIAGAWEVEDVAGVVVFQPEQPLATGVYYAVNMDNPDAQMSGDFYVDEDPQVQAIFPAANSESHEDTEITIVFNRPMVPLTTLTEQEKIELPITINPPTPGAFKWISTRNLQFKPETTLIPSSQYTVMIGDGLVSADGLPIPAATHQFMTRPLRYEQFSAEQISYRKPIILTFNQPVDIDETRKNITITTKENEAVAIDVEYGETTYYDYETRETVTETDPSKLFVYQKRDRHGRSHLWDFDTTYNVSVSGASPLAGNYNLTSGKHTTVSVPNIIKGTRATSDRTTLARPDFFDPTGNLIVTFYEDIDIDSSRIDAKGLTDITYGERCKTDEQGNTIWLGSTCEQEDDRSTIILSFNDSVFSVDEAFGLELNKIKTPDGFTINADPLTLPLKLYTPFSILRSSPTAGATNAKYDGMDICTTGPVRDLETEETLSSYIKTDGYIVYGRWSPTRYIEKKGRYDYCNSGEFQTKLRFGLLPETAYDLQLVLPDPFGQQVHQDLHFTTGRPDEDYTRFHNMQQQYNVTPPERTTLTYAVENLEYVDAHLCRMEPETFLAQTVTRVSNTAAPDSSICSNLVTTRVELPKRYWVNNYFQINLADYFTDTRGHYIITFGNPLMRTYDGERYYDRTYVSVTNLAVGKKEIEYESDPYGGTTNPASQTVLDTTMVQHHNLYWVNRSNSLSPVNGASITQYTGGWKADFAKGSTGFSDHTGIARVAIEENVAGAVIRSGFDTAVITDWADTLRGAGTTRDASRTYIYTDRPIYRPGHTVHIKGIDRIGFDGSYEIWNQDQVSLTVSNSRGEQIFDTKLDMNDYGTFNTEFTLPADTPLGTYSIKAFDQYAWFSVEEYVPAAFKLEATPSKEEFVNGDTFQIEVQADYYFGVPLSEGSVSYSVTAQDYHFDRYTDEYFRFGGNWYYCYWCSYGDDFLFRGQTELNDVGRAVIKRELNFSDYFDNPAEEGSKLVTVSLTTTDINGRSVSTQKSFVVHQGAFYLGAKTDRYYTSKDSPVTFRTKTVDTKGIPIAVSGITRTIHKVSWETFKRQEVDGGFYYRSEKRLEEIDSTTIKTDKNGNWTEELTFPAEGQYEITVSKTDERGNLIETTSNIYIYGERAITVPPNNNYELDLEVEKSNVEVGDTATLLIKSPYESAKVLITAERGTVYDYWIADVQGGLYVHEFPITSEYTPNIFVSALLLSGDPEVKYGSVRYEVGREEKELDVTVTPNKTHYLPGESVTLRVETKDHTGQPVAAEVSLAVADLSVLALKGNPKKDPTLFFFDGFPLSVTTASNIKNILYEVDIPLGTKGGGGNAPDDLSKKKRGEFKDTAFWQASITTDTSGKAAVTFTLPDNLTTWQIEGLGVTKDTKLGVDYTEFTTKKDLMAVPLKPRFVVPGDSFSLGANVFNQTESGAEITVTIESDTLTLPGETTQSLFINKNESKTVYFDTVAPTSQRAGEHTFTFTASSDSFIDSVEQTIAITPNTTYETVATANFTKADQATEYIYVPDTVLAGKGGLSINTNATLAVFMSDALTYMATYPYGCSEQLASALSTIAILKDALELPHVEGSFDTIEHEGVTYDVDTVVADGLQQIYQAQTGNGGFSYYRGLLPSLRLTMHVTETLLKLQEAGFEVSEPVLQRATAFIETQALSEYRAYPEANREVVIFGEYVLRAAGDRTQTSLTPIVEQLLEDGLFLNEQLSSLGLGYLAILTTDNYTRSHAERAYTTLLNRIDIDGRGAYLTPNKERARYHFETPIKNTAVLLKAFAARKDEHETTGNVLRWLLASRDHQGVWGNTHNTFAVVDAMVDYLKWQHETESHFTLRGLLGDEEIFGYEFKPETIFNTFTHQIGVDDIPRTTMLPFTFKRENHNELQNNFYYDMTLKYYLPVQSLPPRDEGITITRELYALDDERETIPRYQAEVGEVLKGKLTLTTPDHYQNITIEDMIPAGFEIVNFNLDTESKELFENLKGIAPQSGDKDWLASLRQTLRNSQTAQVYQTHGFGGTYQNKTRTLRPSHTESHDDRVFLFVNRLNPGVYEYEYYVRALVPGEFQYLPARSEQMMFPEVFGRTGGGSFTITKEQ